MADRILERIVAYLAGSLDLVLVFWVVPGDLLAVLTYGDADLGGCPFTGRSTSGAVTFLIGSKGTWALVSWRSHRQGATAGSTAEAEIVSLAEAGRRDTVPITDLLEQILSRKVEAMLLTDSAAAKAAAEKGSSTTMRHLRKVHRILSARPVTSLMVPT